MYSQPGFSLGNFQIERPTTRQTTSAATGQTMFVTQAPAQRPFERFTSDFFDFTGGLFDAVGDGLELFGGRPAQQGPGVQAQTSTDNTLLLVGAGVLVLALVLRANK